MSEIYIADWQPARLFTRAHAECFPEDADDPRFQEFLGFTGKIVRVRLGFPPMGCVAQFMQRTRCSGGQWVEVHPEDREKMFYWEKDDSTPLFLCEHMYHTD